MWNLKTNLCLVRAKRQTPLNYWNSSSGRFLHDLAPVEKKIRTAIYNRFFRPHQETWQPSSGVIIRQRARRVRLRRCELQVRQQCLTPDRCSTQSTKGSSSLYVKSPGGPSGDFLPACVTLRPLVYLDKWKGWNDDDDDETAKQTQAEGTAAVLPGQPATSGRWSDSIWLKMNK